MAVVALILVGCFWFAGSLCSVYYGGPWLPRRIKRDTGFD